METFLVFGRFSLDDGLKRVKKCVLSLENGFLWSESKKIQINV